MAQANVVNTLVVPAQSRVAPFYDDFDETKNFHRIMFRPGYAVQARELTQLQTILQNQIERFGRHIFVNGSSVIGGKLDITDVITLNVEAEYANSFINIADFKNKTIRLSSGNNDVLARVVQTSNATDTQPPALHIKYVSGQEFSPGATITTTTGNLFANLVSTSNVSSNGRLAFLYDSIYFMQGYFIKVPSQSVIVSKYTTQSNARVGLELTEEFVDENSDTSLLDPAQESSNYQAPGASRYRLDLVLSSRSLDSEDDEKFIEINKIENGVIREQVRTPLYSEIEEVLARRTYDESGNYIVKPYTLTVTESKTDPTNNFTLVVSAGKSYIYGFETESLVDTRIEIPRSRETEAKENFSLNLNYGNYVIVEDMTGAFNLQGQGIIDLHCVDKNNVSTANTTTYNSTKVGTARVRDLNFYSGSSNVSTRQFELYFYDNKFTSLTANASGTSTATNQIIMNTVQTSRITDAYTGAYIFIEAGPNAGERREIVSYNGASKVANVNPGFTSLCNVNSRYSIQYDITDVDSFIQSVPYTSGATANANATISLLNKDSGTLNGNTFIYEPSLRSVLFKFPENFVAPGMTDESYIYRRTFPSVQFTTGTSAVLTASSDEEFEGASSTSNVSSTVMDNFLVVVTNPLTSSRAVGEQVRVTTSVSNSTPEQAILSTSNTGESFIATVYAKMQVQGVSAVPRVKTLVLANTQSFTSESAANTFVNSSGSTTYVYPTSGQVVIINPSKLSTVVESLYLSDVIAVPKIYAITGNTPPTAGSTLSNLLDVTDRYDIDTGQRSTHYDHAMIRLKTGFVAPGAIVVCCRYYRSTSDIGYFSVDSYPSLSSTVLEEGRNIGTGYSLIPYFYNVKLSDVIDFRPVRPNASNNENFTFATARAPVATTDFTSSYSYYMKRRDLVTIAPNKVPTLIQGPPGKDPVFPKVPDRAIVLHKVSLKPYTETVNDVYIDSISLRRYTMEDIGKIDQRLRAVEYGVRLNTLEKKAVDITIKDVDGLDRTKYGILAENFDSALLGDTRLRDFQCSIDYTGKYSGTGGTLMPKLSEAFFDFTLKDDASTNVKVSDNKILLDYTTEVAISQPAATKSTPVAEFLFGDFRGQVVTVPTADIWRDTTTLPPEVITIPTIIDVQIDDPVPIRPEDPRPVPGPDPRPRPDPPITGGDDEWEPIVDLPGPVRPDLPGIILPDPPVTPTPLPPPKRVLVSLADTEAFGGLGIWSFDPVTGNWRTDPGSTTPLTDANGVVQTVAMTPRQIANYIEANIQQQSGQVVSISERQVEFVAQAYQTLFDRVADGVGITYWAKLMAENGYTEREMTRLIIQGGVDSGLQPIEDEVSGPGVDIIDGLYDYTSVSGFSLTPIRDLTDQPDEFAYSTTQTIINASGGTTQQASTRADIIDNRVTQTEYVTDLYRTLAGREPSAEGLEYWTSQIQQYGADAATKAFFTAVDETVAQGFVIGQTTSWNGETVVPLSNFDPENPLGI